MKLRNTCTKLAGLIAATILPICAVHANNTATISYFTIAETDRDANHLASGSFDNEVQNQLGPDGLPVLNTPAYGCVSNCYNPAGAPTDVLANGEITYWSPALNNGGAGKTSDVVFTSNATVSLPFNRPDNFFPPNGNGSSDANGFQAAEITATLTNTSEEQISFSIGADDMAFAYLDGTVVCDLGGVHASTAGTCVTPFDIAPGNHTLDVFFVDINEVQSGLTFDVNTTDVSTNGTIPEPGTWALFAAGMLAFFGIKRRNL